MGLNESRQDVQSSQLQLSATMFRSMSHGELFS